MRFSIPVVLSALLAVGTEARIEGIAAPANIQIGQGFTVRLIGHNYIQSVSEIAAVVGTMPTSMPADTAVGQVLGSYYLGPGEFFSVILIYYTSCATRS